jgi:SAM-dependent methyltransferase
MSSGERHNDYDAFAIGYSRDNDSNATNAYYERPASLALLGDVAGQHVLDAGCGGGAHAAAMIRRGASVTGLDKSAGLLAIARQRLGSGIPLHEADLADPLPFAPASFDAILASLVMHYLQEWGTLTRTVGPVSSSRRRTAQPPKNPYETPGHGRITE